MSPEFTKRCGTCNPNCPHGCPVNRPIINEVLPESVQIGLNAIQKTLGGTAYPIGEGMFTLRTKNNDRVLITSKTDPNGASFLSFRKVN